MPRSMFAFPSLYTATLLMLLGSGLLSTYIALRLAADGAASQAGWLMAAHYAGLVLGGKFGHRLISRVGHVRAYVASGGVVTAAVIGHGLLDWIPAWMVLRFLIGLGMMCSTWWWRAGSTRRPSRTSAVGCSRCTWPPATWA